jgi:plasmid stabilization system protein ParE
VNRRRKVEVHPQAVAEARAAEDWYRSRSPLAARAFVRELDAAIEMLSESPDRWPRFAAGTRRFLMHRFPFIVVYRTVDETIEIVAVAHAMRRPGYWLTR